MIYEISFDSTSDIWEISPYNEYKGKLNSVGVVKANHWVDKQQCLYYFVYVNCKDVVGAAQKGIPMIEKEAAEC